MPEPVPDSLVAETEIVTTDGDAFAATAETAVAVDGLLITMPWLPPLDAALTVRRVHRDRDAGTDAAADQGRDDRGRRDGDQDAATLAPTERRALRRPRRGVPAQARVPAARRGRPAVERRGGGVVTEVAAVAGGGLRVGPGSAVGHGAPFTAHTGCTADPCDSYGSRRAVPRTIATSKLASVMRSGPWRRAAAGAGLLTADGVPGTTIFAEMSALAAATGAINLGQGFPGHRRTARGAARGAGRDRRRREPVPARAAAPPCCGRRSPGTSAAGTGSRSTRTPRCS